MGSRAAAVAALGLFALSIAGCERDPTQVGPPASCRDVVTVEPPALKLFVGSSFVLTTITQLRCEPRVGHIRVYWRSSNPAAAAVDSVTGVVAALAPGSTFVRGISLDDSTVHGTTSVTVEPHPAAPVVAWIR
jgi:uncharacterized protein YjdB